MPEDENQPEKDSAALAISDNLVQDMQGLLLRLHSACDELKELLERVEKVVSQARERINDLAPELGGTRQDHAP